MKRVLDYAFTSRAMAMLALGRALGLFIGWV